MVYKAVQSSKLPANATETAMLRQVPAPSEPLPDGWSRLRWPHCGAAWRRPRSRRRAPAEPPAEAAPQAVPGFWDPRRRPDRPDLSRITVIRFLTETDYPPFNFTGPDGNPAGFNVDFARVLCDEIKVTCTIQMRRFETLVDSLATNRGDAAIASMAATPHCASASISPIPITARRRASCRGATR